MIRTKRQRRRLKAYAGAVAASLPLFCLPAAGQADNGGSALAPASSFARIDDQDTRAAALFTEIGKVFQHPRCMNCHTISDRPFQGDKPRPHSPRVTRGDANFGRAGMYCNSCHQTANVGRVPGNPAWVMAPQSAGWTGLGLGEICAQVKDRARNGNRSLMQIHQHVMEDHLLAYSWSPPSHLEPAPGNRAALGALIEAWIDAGAACPKT